MSSEWFNDEVAMTEQVTEAEYRSRLMDGMAAAVAEKGYAETTIADIVRLARVSKRTFYQHFASKEECLLALYTAATDQLIEVIRRAIEGAHDMHSRVRCAHRAYLQRIKEHPLLMRTLFIEILAAGSRGLQVRRAANQRFADLLRATGADQQYDSPQKRHITPALAMAIVGGINELILQAMESNQIERLLEIEEPATALLEAVLARPIADD
ncbi:MAG TPA: TetR family transcriptional regulator [Herpetosiphon sp.]|nr:TetR family transcriptional regulator [Herpetosiphon sp.]